MNKLLSAGFVRLKKDKVFWIGMAFMAAMGVFVALKTSVDFPIDKTFFIYALPVGFVSAAFCSLFVGTEYADGVIRNKLVVGHRRSAVYLANLVVCASAGIALCAAYILPMLAIALPRLGAFEMGVVPALAMTGITLVLAVAYAAVFTLVGMLNQNRAVVAILCIIGFVALLFVSAWLNSRLNEPEIYDDYVYMDDSGQYAQAGTEPNPNYVSGVEREVFQFALDFLPAGQALMFADMSMIHTWQLPVYSAVIIFLTTAAGMAAFKKKDIK